MPDGSRTLVERIPYTPPMIRSVLSIALAYLLLAAGAPQTAPAGPLTYEAFAVRFGILPAFAVSGLVAGAERGRTLDIPVMVWLLKGSNGRQVLVDSGFSPPEIPGPVETPRFPHAGGCG